MTQEIARAVEVAARLVAGPVVVTGHSAGGQLSARMGCADVSLSAPVKRVVPISPLADLEPLSLTAMNADLGLDAAEIAGESPARLSLRPGVEAHVWVGAQEGRLFSGRPGFCRKRGRARGRRKRGKHHFDVIDGLTDPASALLSVCLKSMKSKLQRAQILTAPGAPHMAQGEKLKR